MDFLIAQKIAPGRSNPNRRPGHLLPQVQRDRALDADRFFDGLMLIFSGLVRKCVVADNCALLANAAFGGEFGPPNFWVVVIGTYAFAWQVYGDFSGYSDIARGSAQLLGFHFMDNFRQPFLAHQLRDFWRRWHISLSTWLRDYLYIPLGGSAGSQWKTSRNLLITMALAGLWHGANWTFVVFGAIHGVVLAVERYFAPSKTKPVGRVAPQRTADLLSVDSVGSSGPPISLRGVATCLTERWPLSVRLWPQRILTFNILCLSLAFFRAASLHSAVQFLAGLSNFAWRIEYASAFFVLGLFCIPLFLVDLLLEANNQEYPFTNSPYAVRTGLAALALVILALFSGNSVNAFVYFQF